MGGIFDGGLVGAVGVGTGANEEIVPFRIVKIESGLFGCVAGVVDFEAVDGRFPAELVEQGGVEGHEAVGTAGVGQETEAAALVDDGGQSEPLLVEVVEEGFGRVIPGEPLYAVHQGLLIMLLF